MPLLGWSGPDSKKLALDAASAVTLTVTVAEREIAPVVAVTVMR